jgi:hypothetical protein
LEGSGNLLIIPEGLVIDTEKRQNLTPKVNVLFAVKRSFPNDKKNIKKELPTENGEESFFVAGVRLLSLRLRGLVWGA